MLECSPTSLSAPSLQFKTRLVPHVTSKNFLYKLRVHKLFTKVINSASLFCLFFGAGGGGGGVGGKCTNRMAFYFSNF